MCCKNVQPISSLRALLWMQAGGLSQKQDVGEAMRTVMSASILGESKFELCLQPISRLQIVWQQQITMNSDAHMQSSHIITVRTRALVSRFSGVCSCPVVALSPGHWWLRMYSLVQACRQSAPSHSPVDWSTRASLHCSKAPQKASWLDSWFSRQRHFNT